MVVGDATATAALRKSIASQASLFQVVADETNPYEGIRGRHRVLRVHPSSGLRPNQLVELLGRHPAPLRSWVKLDAAVPAGAVPLDEFGRRVLGVEPGAKVRLRVLPAPIEPCSQ